MRRNGASTRGDFLRSSRSGWPSGFELLLVAAAAFACGGAGTGGGASVTPQDIAFTDHGVTQHSRTVSGPRIVVAVDPGPTGLAELAGPAQPGRLYVAVFQGEQRTGGYSVTVDRIERDGTSLVVRATFHSPPPGSLNIQVITSPARLVSIERQNASGVREAILLDQSGTELGRTAVPQSPT